MTSSYVEMDIEDVPEVGNVVDIDADGNTTAGPYFPTDIKKRICVGDLGTSYTDLSSRYTNDSPTNFDEVDVRDKIRIALESRKTGGCVTSTSKVAKYLPSMPDLYVEGYGIVPLPVNESVARDLHSFFEVAPFGLGEETVYDESVRCSWQLAREKFEIKNKKFLSMIEKKVVEEVKEELGCPDSAVCLEMYKLLLYETGGHFKPHRDTEKSNGMFATLIVQLPSKFTGGNLILSHNNRRKVIKFAHGESTSTCMYAAHYSDIEHEITKVTSGFRLAIAFSLCWDGNGIVTNHTGQELAVRKLLKNLATQGGPKVKMAWALNHVYSLESLKSRGVMALKGKDKFIAETLCNAVAGMGYKERFSVYIAKYSKYDEQHGYCTREDMYSYNSWDIYPYDSDDNCSEFGETSESGVELKDFISTHGYQLQIANFNLDDNDIINRDDMSDDWWSEEEEGSCSGPTGNVGATRTYWYHRYLLILWKDSEFMKILKNNPEAAIKHVTNNLDDSVDDADKVQLAVNQSMQLMLFFSVEKSCFLDSSGTKDLVALLQRLENACIVKTFIRLLVANNRKNSQPCVPGVLNEHVCGYLINSLNKYSWLALKTELEEFIISQPPEQVAIFLKLCPSDVPKSDIANQLGEIHIGDKKKIEDENLNAISLVIFRYPDMCSKYLSHLPDLSNLQRITVLAELMNHLFLNVEQSLIEGNVYFKLLESKFVQLAQRKSSRRQMNSVMNVAAMKSVYSVMTEIKSNDNLMLLNAVIQTQRPNDNLLSKLLEDYKEHIPVLAQSLAGDRIKQLESVVGSGVPPFSWCQPSAVIRRHPKVQKYLRGPTETFKYSNFNDFDHACNWANKHFCDDSSDDDNTYSAEVHPGGAGKEAYAIIKKTRRIYEKQVKVYTDRVSEYNRLKSLLAV